MVSSITFADPAWKIYENWAKTIDKDTHVSIGCFPSESIKNSVLSPPENLFGAITREGISIAHHYSTINAFDDEIPDIGPP